MNLNPRKVLIIGVLLAFLINTFGPICPIACSAEGEDFRLPVPGVMVYLSPEFTPAHLQGITIHSDNALQFDFLIHKGDQDLEGDQRQEEYKKLVKYFLASLTIPDEDQWVNLSPYEKDRIIKDDFGKTEMGRDLLAQDYMLKQITSSLIYPEDGLGKKFWDKVYERAWNEYHTTDIPVNTFNKVWIVPDQAIVYESGNTAYILKSHLKVMLEEDYLSLEKHVVIFSGAKDLKRINSLKDSSAAPQNDEHAIASQLIREIILPELEKEVNEGKNFASLRQMYSGMVLATWYKKALKESLLGKVYANKAKVKGVDQDPKTNEAIYRQYLKAFKKGVFNYIKEDVDKYTKEVIPRKYFSGGWEDFNRVEIVTRNTDFNHLRELFIVGPATISFIPKADMTSLASEDSLDRAIVTFNAEEDNTEKNPSGGNAAMSIHVLQLKSFLRILETRGDLKDFVPKENQQKKNILERFFGGQSVLNIGPENNTITGELEDENIVTALLKIKGIDAVALSPESPNPKWPTGRYVKQKVQEMDLGEKEFDNVVIVSLFEQFYWEELANGRKTLEAINEMYPDIAKRLQRVLKDKGRFFLINASDNVKLIKALKDQGFEDVFNKNNIALFINHKYAVMKTDKRLANSPKDVAMTSTEELVRRIKEDPLSFFRDDLPQTTFLKTMDDLQNFFAKQDWYYEENLPGKVEEFLRTKKMIVVDVDENSQMITAEEKDSFLKDGEDYYIIPPPRYKQGMSYCTLVYFPHPELVAQAALAARFEKMQEAGENQNLWLEGQVVDNTEINLNQKIEKLKNIYIATTKDGSRVAVKVSKGAINKKEVYQILEAHKNDLIALKKYGGPQYYGRVTLTPGKRPGVAMEIIKGIDLLSLKQGVMLPFEITDKHVASMESLLNKLNEENEVFIGVQFDKFMLTLDGRVRPLNMSVGIKGKNDKFGNKPLKDIIDWLEENKDRLNEEYRKNLKDQAMIGNPFSKFFGPDPTTGQRLQDQDTLRETMSKLRSNMEKGEVAGSLYFRQTINHLNLKLYGHGTDDNTLTAAEGILTDGKLKHKKGSIQYGILGNPAYRPHDEGTGLFILDPQLQDEQIFEGPNEVSLKSIKYIVFSEENVESIRSDPKFVQYSAKIFSYSELAEKLNKDNALLATKGGIDLNSANMNLQIKRDGRGVPLPLAQQDMAQLSRIQGFEPEILEITPAVNLPILSELRQKLQAAAT